MMIKARINPRIQYVIFLTAGFFSLVSCEEKPEVPVPTKAPIRVEILEVESSTFQESIVASGVASASVERRVSTRVNGMLKARNVERGDKVSKGQVIFEIDPEEFQLRLKDKTANLASFEARLRYSEKEVKRQGPLFEDGTVSQAQWDRLQFNLETALSERDQAAVALEQAQRDLRLTQVRSPISGLVLERYRESGEVISAGTVLAWVVNTAKMSLEIGLSDQELAHVHRGDPIKVWIDALGTRVFQGKISQISGNADPKIGTFPVEVTVENKDFKILPGMVGRLEIPGEIHRDKIIIPLMAVKKDLEGSFVFLEKEGRIEKRAVKLGKILAPRVLIKKGIKAGDRIILVHQGRLKEGDPVEVILKHSTESPIGG